jgi:hypothetical protein
MDTKIINGVVIDKTNNSIKINKIWIKFFKNELLQGISKGDEVEVKYIDNVKDDKTYHNGKEIKLTSNTVNTEQINSKYIDKDKTACMLTSYVKDLMVAVLNNSGKINNKELLLETYDELNKLMIESYNRIKKELI